MARWDMSQRLLTLVIIFIIALGMLAMLHGAAIPGETARYETDFNALILTIGMAAVTLVCAAIIPKLLGVDALLMTLVNFLCTLGIFIQYSIRPSGGMYHALFYGSGMIVMLAASQMIRKTRSFKRLWPWLCIAAAALLIAPLFTTVNNAHAHIPLTRNANNEITMTIQPSEFVKVILVIVLAEMLTRHNWWPSGVYALGLSGICVILLMFEEDLGTCMLYAATIVMIFYAASGSFTLLLTGAAAGVGAARILYGYRDNVQTRVAMWLNPFMRVTNKKGEIGLQGHQIAESLMALAAGGVHGLGYGIRDTFRYVPEYPSDFVFTVVCSQFGIIFGLCVLLVYVLILYRGFTIAARAKRRSHALMAIGATAMLGFQTFVIIGGVVNMFPITGVTMPFVSQGGSSMLSCMMLIGIINGVHACSKDDSKRISDLLNSRSVSRSVPIYDDEGMEARL